MPIRSFKAFAAAFAAALLVGFVPRAMGQTTPQTPPPMMPCGAQSGVEIICGTHSPEDLEPTPDGKFLIVSEFVNGRTGGGQPEIVLFDLAKETFAKIPISVGADKNWGEAACPGPTDALRPHGLSLSKRKAGAWQLFVVNHGGRQSMEMFELKKTSGNWGLIWRGCVVSKAEFNDVAALPDGGFIATHPLVLRAPDAPGNIFDGQVTGTVIRWSAEKGETDLPGARAGYTNGVLVSADGRYAYYNAWTNREVHKYDLAEQKEAGVVKLDFMPDNLTWTRKRQMLAAGVKATRGECASNTAEPCLQGFGVALINPERMDATRVFDSANKGALIRGASVALQVRDAIYIGAFQGDRLVKIPWREAAPKK